MPNSLRPFARSLYELPFVGRVVLWVSLLLRLPALQRRVQELEQRQAMLETRQAITDELAAQVARLSARLDAAEALLAASGPPLDNLVSSVPVALRRSARDIAALRERIDLIEGTPRTTATKEPA
ncbi:MAG TPA: hypothetical protein VLJ58_17855 [Ramlibacter sp.]|nr:hypothetical protein [Ramlibacter sp.]